MFLRIREEEEEGGGRALNLTTFVVASKDDGDRRCRLLFVFRLRLQLLLLLDVRKGPALPWAPAVESHPSQCPAAASINSISQARSNDILILIFLSLFRMYT